MYYRGVIAFLEENYSEVSWLSLSIHVTYHWILHIGRTASDSSLQLVSQRRPEKSRVSPVSPIPGPLVDKSQAYLDILDPMSLTDNA